MVRGSINDDPGGRLVGKMRYPYQHVIVGHDRGRPVRMASAS